MYTETDIRIRWDSYDQGGQGSFFGGIREDYVTPILEPKERSHRVCMILDNKEQLTSLLPYAGHAILPADRELRKSIFDSIYPAMTSLYRWCDLSTSAQVPVSYGKR